VRLVLPLPPDCQERLLRDAETQAWSVERLDREVASLGATPQGIRGGRKRSPVRKALSVLERCVDTTTDLVRDASKLEFSPETTRSLEELSRRLQEVCDRLEARTTNGR